MGYRPPMRTPRASGLGKGTLRHEKAKAKGPKHRRRVVRSSTADKRHVAAAKEIVEKTLRRLRTLGSQRFGSSPFSEHFTRWLMNLKDVLSEFELSPNIKVDEQFTRERSKILMDVELELEERRRKEASVEDHIKSLSTSKDLLERIKKEYAARAREVERRKKGEIKRLNSKIDSLRGELDDTVRMRTGLFRGISKKAREQKETETKQELDNKQRALELAMLDFAEIQERLLDEYERKRQPVIEQIRVRRKKIENLETDGSLEDRWFACEALIDAVNAFLQRKTLEIQ